jgi:hypothetical protein
MHPIVDAFARPEVVARGDARLQIDDPSVGRDSLQFCDCITPDVGWSDRTGNWSVCLFRQGDVIARIPDIRLLNSGRTWMRQDLVDTAASHHISAQEEGDHYLG